MGTVKTRPEISFVYSTASIAHSSANAPPRLWPVMNKLRYPLAMRLITSVLIASRACEYLINHNSSSVIDSIKVLEADAPAIYQPQPHAVKVFESHRTLVQCWHAVVVGGIGIRGSILVEEAFVHAADLAAVRPVCYICFEILNPILQSLQKRARARDGPQMDHFLKQKTVLSVLLMLVCCTQPCSCTASALAGSCIGGTSAHAG